MLEHRQQTNTADMLDLALDYIKNLQKQVKVLIKLSCRNILFVCNLTLDLLLVIWRHCRKARRAAVVRPALTSYTDRSREGEGNASTTAICLQCLECLRFVPHTSHFVNHLATHTHRHAKRWSVLLGWWPMGEDLAINGHLAYESMSQVADLGGAPMFFLPWLAI